MLGSPKRKVVLTRLMMSSWLERCALQFLQP